MYLKYKLKDLVSFGLGLTATPHYVSSGIPFLSSKNISNDYIDFSDIKYISKDDYIKASNSAKPRIGDILFTRVGSNLGHPVIVETNTPFIIFVSLGFLRTKSQFITNYYLLSWMNSDHFWKQVKSQIAGSSKFNLNIGWLEEFSISIPNIDEQTKVANMLKLINQRIDTQSKIIEDLECQIKWIKVKFFNSYINCNSYQFNNLFFEYKKLNNLAYKQYTIGKYGIKELNYDSNLYTTNKHIIFEPNTLILGIGIEEIGVSDELFGCCSPIYKTFCINNQIINTCWFYYFANMYFDKIKRFVTQKSTRREFEFDYKALNIIKFSIPTLDIQKIHCDLLNFISTKIQKEKDILKLYKKQKAYLLKNMFI